MQDKPLNSLGPSNARPWRGLLLLLILATLALAAILLPLRVHILHALEYAQGLKGLAVPIIIAIYIVGCVMMFPGSLLGMATGFILGLPLGVAVSITGATLGATVAMFVGRTVARPWVAQKIAGHRRWQALDAAIGQQAFRVVFLVRITPLLFPFNFSNYAFGLTKVGTLRYMAATFLGKLPGAVVACYIGTTVASIHKILSGHPVQLHLRYLLAILPLTVVGMLLLYRFGRRALQQAMPDSDITT